MSPRELSEPIVDAALIAQRPTAAVLAPHISEGWREYLRLGAGKSQGLRSAWAFPESIYQPPRLTRGSVEGDANLWGTSSAAEVEGDPLAAVRSYLDANDVEMALIA